MIKHYQFGLLDPISGFNEQAIEQLYLRNKLWNNLVALEIEHRKEYRDLLLNSNQELSSLQAEMDIVQSKIEELVKSKKALRQKERSKKVDDNLLNDQIKTLKIQSQLITQRTREVRARVKVDISPKIAELNKKRYDKAKELRQECGLWWGNYQTVIEAYFVARVKAMKSNAELKFKRFDGTGKFAVGFQNGITFQELIEGKSNDLIIQNIDTSHLSHLSINSIKSHARHHLKICLFTYTNEQGKKARHFLTLPLIMHRDIESDGKIKYIHVLRKRIGNRFTWSCSITMHANDVEKTISDHDSAKAVGIDLGFRLVEQGLRIATLVDTAGYKEHFILPKEWLSRMDYAETLQAALSEEMTLMWSKLKTCISLTVEYPEPIREFAEGIQNAGGNPPFKIIKKLYKLLIAAQSLLPEAYEVLLAHDKATYKRQREMVNLKSKLLSQRKHIYRNFAHRISREYGHVIIEDMNLSEMIKTEASEKDNLLPKAARSNRQRASLYELVETIRLACIKTGAKFEKVKAVNSSLTCSVCGFVNVKTVDIDFTCSSCGKLHDIDENAAKNFLNGENFYLSSKVNS